MTNSPNRDQPVLSRRRVMLAGAILATAGVGYSWATSLLNPKTEGMPKLPRRRRAASVTADDLLKPGPLPELVIGRADAPVTIIEYASMTCPHCARFHSEILPVLKEKYIDKGHARLLFREFPLDDVAMLASMTARCAGTEKALPLISALFSRQDEWRQSKSLDELRGKLFALGQQVGLTRQAFDACVPSGNELSPQQRKLLTDIHQVRTRANEGYGVNQTPTFFVNGKKLAHATIEGFDKAIEPLIKR